ncbi:MAG: glycine cleavage system aminomethyltransferase GcvT [Verrucomicrobiae bacterium]|nr:glycine cleavage system aminomethyltransferase GcvT [Verrucomicrobiae bacterium]
MSGLKRTPLFGAHLRRQARMVEFGGWEMPVQYTSIVEEHLCVRRAAGIFDISHMGEVRCQGPAATAFLNELLTNDIRKLGVGQGQYTLMCNPRGGVVDDLYVFRRGEQDFLLVINASRIEADWNWMQERCQAFPHHADVHLENQSDLTGAVAIQGPATVHFIQACLQGPATAGAAVASVTELKKNQIARFAFQGMPVWVSRTGYTGEDGFEVYTSASLIESLWEACLEAGRAAGLQPAGLGARDTLRTEMGYPLYGHELDENTTPLEAGLKMFVALDKGPFVGRAVLEEQARLGPARRCVAFKMPEKQPPPRPGYPIWVPGLPAPAGQVVSGTQSPSLGVGIGMGYVPAAYALPHTMLEIEIRGRRIPAEIVPKPLYRPPTTA